MRMRMKEPREKSISSQESSVLSVHWVHFTLSSKDPIDQDVDYECILLLLTLSTKEAPFHPALMLIRMEWGLDCVLAVCVFIGESWRELLDTGQFFETGQEAMIQPLLSSTLSTLFTFYFVLPPHNTTQLIATHTHTHTTHTKDFSPSGSLY